jgi:hypothetical protein
MDCSFHDVHSIYTTNYNVFVPSTGVDTTIDDMQRVDDYGRPFI